MRIGSCAAAVAVIIVAVAGMVLPAVAVESVAIQLGPPPESFFPDVRSVLEQLAETYNATHSGVVVSVAPDNPAFAVHSATRADVGDVVFLPTCRFGEAALLAEYAAEGLLEPITSFVEAPDFNRPDYFAGLWDAVTVGDDVYAVPLTVRSWAVGVNEAYCEKATLTPYLADWGVLLDFMENTWFDMDNDGVVDALMVQTGREPMFLWEALFLEYGGDPDNPESFRPGCEAWDRATARVTDLVARSPSLFVPRELSHRRFDTHWQPVQFAHNDGMDPGALPMLRKRSPYWTVLSPPGTAALPCLDTTVVAVATGTQERVMAAWEFVAWLTSPEIMTSLYSSASLLPVRRSVASTVSDETTRVFLNSLERMRYQRPQLNANEAISALRVALEGEL